MTEELNQEIYGGEELAYKVWPNYDETKTIDDVIQIPVQVNGKLKAVVEVEKEAPKGKAITSPMVGTFYAAPSPEAEAFVEVGKTISEGDVVCIVEAMKLMNEIKADHAGKVTQICVKNGDPVEFGQVLMYVE